VTIQTTLAELDEVVRSAQFNFADELDLQNGLAIQFDNRNIQYQREALIGAASESRVDFLISRIALEVKVGGSLADVMRQLSRYAKSPSVDALMLVTSRLRHRVCLPEKVNGKPLQVTEIVRL
jgi:hypothetical protein